MTKNGKASADEERRLSFREQIFGKRPYAEDDSKVKRINVMTRVRADVVDVLDALVELGAFNSRSEAVSAYLEHIILSKKDLYDKLRERAKEVGKMRESAMELAIEAFRDT